MRLNRILFSAAIALMLVSCSGSRSALPYFTDIATVKEGTLPLADYMPKIVPDDELSIVVNSLMPQATTAYNMANSNIVTEVLPATTQLEQQTYIVDSKGDINFPVLGKIHVGGMTVEQVSQELTTRIARNVENPIVTVRLVNFKVNVAGEVKNPGVIPVPNNRMTILDALSAAGDLTEYGERSNVLIIREENGERKFAHLDLNSSDLLTSPYYYVKQNDYIYVEPNSIRQSNSKYNQNNAFKLSVISTIVSAASVIASLVIALSVK